MRRTKTDTLATELRRKPSSRETYRVGRWSRPHHPVVIRRCKHRCQQLATEQLHRALRRQPIRLQDGWLASAAASVIGSIVRNISTLFAGQWNRQSAEGRSIPPAPARPLFSPVRPSFHSFSLRLSRSHLLKLRRRRVVGYLYACVG